MNNLFINLLEVIFFSSTKKNHLDLMFLIVNEKQKYRFKLIFFVHYF